MATTAALGNGPIMFFHNGAHIEVPLSDIVFEDGQIDTTRADLKALPDFVNWLTFLGKQKRIVPASKPIAKAMVLRAVEPGAVGNNIALTVLGKTPTTVDLTASETDTYPNLTMATLKTRLGEDGGAPGSQPGLLHVKTFPAGSEALTVIATANPVNPTGTTNPKWTLAGTGAAAVTLEPRRGGAGFNGGDVKNIVISNVSPDGSTFTLTVNWSKKQQDVNEAGLAAAFTNLGYLITATPPDGGFKLPRAGTVRLTGGAEEVTIAATTAGATVLANP